MRLVVATKRFYTKDEYTQLETNTILLVDDTTVIGAWCATPSRVDALFDALLTGDLSDWADQGRRDTVAKYGELLVGSELYDKMDELACA